jgi:pyridoxal phosphate enzyme (YggS family)
LIDRTAVDAVARARARVLERIGAAAARVGRDPSGVQLVAVTKTVAPERIRAGVEAGLTTLGENRVQEAEAKRPLVGGGTWHLIGPLQSNKARRAVGTFDVIQTVDSLELAMRLGRIAAELGRAPYPVLLQVNVDADPAKAGFEPAALEGSIGEMAAVDGLRLDGLMTVGALVEQAEDARPTFISLRRLSQALRAAEPRLGVELSMGMTDDFEVAVEEGATIVRVGRALFGERG